jgi:hypothetical protein
MPTPADAARCVSGADVRQQVSTFVRGLHDDVAPAARTAVKGAFVESVKAARGAKADTPQENRGLGKEISALARQLKDAPGLVERKALIAEIHALQDQKKANHVKHGEVVATIRADVAKVGRAIAKKTDSKAEGRQVAAFVHQLMAQFNC